MALNPEWNLDDTVKHVPQRPIPTQDQFDKQGTVRPRDQPPLYKAPDPPIIPDVEPSTISIDEKLINRLEETRIESISTIKSINEEKNKENNEIIEKSPQKSKRLYSTIGNTILDLKDSTKYQNTVRRRYLITCLIC